jgi:MFS family permease
MVIMGMLCTKIASGPLKFGRVQTTALYEIGGILLLLSMVYYKQYLNLHPFLLVPIYIMRTSLMNSTYPLQESILMDYVPKSSRGRWKSLDSVASFGWCGSAAFGGWLADKYDYTHTFLCTAIFQIVALCIWCLLLPLVPRIEGSDDACSSISSTDNDNSNDNNNNGANNGSSNDDEDGNSGGNVVIVNDDDVNDNGTCITPLVDEPSNSAATATSTCTMTELSEPLL